MRQHRRVTFRNQFRVRVLLRENDELLGYAGDISFGGFRLISDAPVEAGSELALRLKIREGEDRTRYIDVDVVCQWSRANPKRDNFEAGMALDGPCVAFAEYVRTLGAAREARV